MFALAAPVVVAELGWITMGMVDTLMVGPLGAAAIGAVGLGSSLFTAVAIFAMGMLLGLDPLVSQSFGAGRLDECHRWLLHGIYLALLLAIPSTFGVFALVASLDHWHMNPDVLRLTRPYLEAVAWSVPPLLIYFALRRYLQSVSIVRPIMLTLIGANVLNVIVNGVLIYGRFGAPAMGVAGAAWATVLSRVAMAASLLAVVLVHERAAVPRVHVSWRFEVIRIKKLLVVGFPAAMQLTLEVGVFAAASALAGRMLPVSLAAHQIALNLAGFTFMVPLGIASAGAVRVGQAVGRGDHDGAARAGWTALALGAAFMSVAALAFTVIPRQLVGAFTADPRVLDLGAGILAVAAIFQLFDGLQGVGTGVLRGLGDTRTPMLWNLGGHWLIGLPVAYVLAFRAGLGVIGLWWGLSSGLIICGVALLIVWRKRIRAVPRLL
jgi:multidrug resistance protein, MATE family